MTRWPLIDRCIRFAVAVSLLVMTGCGSGGGSGSATDAGGDFPTFSDTFDEALPDADPPGAALAVDFDGIPGLPELTVHLDLPKERAGLFHRLVSGTYEGDFDIRSLKTEDGDLIDPKYATSDVPAVTGFGSGAVPVVRRREGLKTHMVIDPVRLAEQINDVADRRIIGGNVQWFLHSRRVKSGIMVGTHRYVIAHMPDQRRLVLARVLEIPLIAKAQNESNWSPLAPPPGVIAIRQASTSPIVETMGHHQAAIAYTTQQAEAWFDAQGFERVTDLTGTGSGRNIGEYAGPGQWTINAQSMTERIVKELALVRASFRYDNVYGLPPVEVKRSGKLNKRGFFAFHDQKNEVIYFYGSPAE